MWNHLIVLIITAIVVLGVVWVWHGISAFDGSGISNLKIPSQEEVLQPTQRANVQFADQLVAMQQVRDTATHAMHVQQEQIAKNTHDRTVITTNATNTLLPNMGAALDRNIAKRIATDRGFHRLMGITQEEARNHHTAFMSDLTGSALDFESLHHETRAVISDRHAALSNYLGDTTTGTLWPLEEAIHARLEGVNPLSLSNLVDAHDRTTRDTLDAYLSLSNNVPRVEADLSIINRHYDDRSAAFGTMSAEQQVKANALNDWHSIKAQEMRDIQSGISVNAQTVNAIANMFNQEITPLINQNVVLSNRLASTREMVRDVTDALQRDMGSEDARVQAMLTAYETDLNMAATHVDTTCNVSLNGSGSSISGDVITGGSGGIAIRKPGFGPSLMTLRANGTVSSDTVHASHTLTDTMNVRQIAMCNYGCLQSDTDTTGLGGLCMVDAPTIHEGNLVLPGGALTMRNGVTISAHTNQGVRVRAANNASNLLPFRAASVRANAITGEFKGGNLAVGALAVSGAGSVDAIDVTMKDGLTTQDALIRNDIRFGPDGSGQVLSQERLTVGANDAIAARCGNATRWQVACCNDTSTLRVQSMQASNDVRADSLTLSDSCTAHNRVHVGSSNAAAADPASLNVAGTAHIGNRVRIHHEDTGIVLNGGDLRVIPQDDVVNLHSGIVAMRAHDGTVSVPRLCAGSNCIEGSHMRALKRLRDDAVILFRDPEYKGIRHIVYVDSSPARAPLVLATVNMHYGVRSVWVGKNVKVHLYEVANRNMNGKRGAALELLQSTPTLPTGYGAAEVEVLPRNDPRVPVAPPQGTVILNADYDLKSSNTLELSQPGYYDHVALGLKNFSAVTKSIYVPPGRVVELWSGKNRTGVKRVENGPNNLVSPNIPVDFEVREVLIVNHPSQLPTNDNNILFFDDQGMLINNNVTPVTDNTTKEVQNMNMSRIKAAFVPSGSAVLLTDGTGKQQSILGPGMAPISSPPTRITVGRDTGLTPVDCQLSEWSAWSQCTVACGPGTRTRTRTNVQEGRNGGRVCPSNLVMVEEEACFEKPCPIRCEVKTWTEWSDCSHSCNHQSYANALREANGTNVTVAAPTRRRYPWVVQPAMHGGSNCTPAMLAPEVEACNASNMCPVDCVKKWDRWSDCEGGCDQTLGTQRRTEVVGIAAAHGGSNCTNFQTEQRQCPLGVLLRTGNGTQVRRPVGMYNIDQMGLPNDAITYLEVPKNYGIHVFEHSDFHGHNHWFGEGNYTLSAHGWHNRISSYVVTRPGCRQHCTPVGGWNSSGCSTACGAGTVTSTRHKVGPYDGGAGCPNHEVWSQTNCIGTNCPPVDCGVHWSEWSGLCWGMNGYHSKQRRTPTIFRWPEYNGTACPTGHEERDCFNRNSGVFRWFTPDMAEIAHLVYFDFDHRLEFSKSMFNFGPVGQIFMLARTRMTIRFATSKGMFYGLPSEVTYINDWFGDRYIYVGQPPTPDIENRDPDIHWRVQAMFKGNQRIWNKFWNDYWLGANYCSVRRLTVSE